MADAKPISPNPFWAGTPVTVFGGTGFLGRHIVSQLLAAGAAVRTLALPGPTLDPHPQLDARTGDATDPATVRAAVDGARVVFLAAGPTPRAGARMGAHTSALDTVLAALPPTARLVLTSSIVAIGGTKRGEVLTEGSPFPNAALRSDYVRAKRAAEEVALAARDRDIVVTNPGYLFGPDDPVPSVMGDFCVRFWRGHLGVPPVGGISTCDVRDVAAGHLLAAECGTAGRRYILAGENVRWAALFAALARAAGLRALFPTFPVPIWPWVGSVLATAGVLASTVTGGRPFLTHEVVRMSRLRWFVSSDRARVELGYSCRPLADTLSDAFAWHAARRRVAPRGLNRLWLWRSPPRSV